MNLRKLPRKQQYLVAFMAVVAVAGGFFAVSDHIGYRVVAFSLLLTVSLLAMFLDIFPVLLAAFLSALLWDFFFIPPRFTFSVGNTDDQLMLLTYFLIALINAVLTFKIRQTEKREQQKEEKEKTLKLYNTLLNSLSHELRTPISTIIGASDNLSAINSKLSDDHKKELLSEISKASLRLNRQVENLLNMSRLESGSVHLNKDWCDINELIYDVVNRMRDNLGERHVEILVQENMPLFKIDFGLMEQVLYNLVYNANAYIPKYCLITIRGACINEQLIIEVEDNGEGFPEEEIIYVFDKFYRLKNTATGGTGLGLSIVKGFVEAHNGTVSLINIPEGGAKFIISIPAEISYLNHLKNE